MAQKMFINFPFFVEFLLLSQRIFGCGLSLVICGDTTPGESSTHAIHNEDGNQQQGALERNNRRRASQQTLRQRRRGNRRANRERQVQQMARANLVVVDETAPCENTTKAAGGASSDLLLCIGHDLLYNQVAINGQDQCAVCLDRFDNELADTYCAVLTCRHACCVPCLKAVEKHADGIVEIACPTCRASQKTDLARIPYELYPTQVGDRLDILSGVSTTEKIDMFKSLLQFNNYQMGKVDQALEDMVVGSIATRFTTTNNARDLTSQEKQSIYMETQRPVRKICQELDEARKILQETRSTKAYKKNKQRVEYLKKCLVQAANNAQEDAYNQINSGGNMGIMDNEGNLKVVQVDYHGLHKDAAAKKFDELVVPLLPTLGKINIITGWGKHSSTGVGVLQLALRDHIDNHRHNDCMKWEPVEGNTGIVQVVWISGSD
ncbi:expressed unknown protein [Seminavis robusta]|uniref:RING-type domain-containing protein n=1 Tax=Seminavis robusta TaxID=568900 RepID=A0A9N8EEB8_9STRA|nr:expressed unknown protein [Seminavis robusta]|eukprot:Sro999_g229660.1 n/a (436) ;mRNA; f:17278-18585